MSLPIYNYRKIIYFLLGLSFVLLLAFPSPVLISSTVVLLIAVLMLEYNSPGRYIRKGIARYTANDYAGAVSEYTQAILRKPSAAAYSHRGQARLALQDYQGSLEDCELALQYNSNHSESYSNRGKARYFLGDKVGAMEDCNRAIELNPESVEDYLGRSLMRVQDPQLALADLDRAVEIVERFPEANQRHIGYAKMYTSRGVIHNLLGNYQAALADSQRTIERVPTFGDAYTCRGDAYLKLGNHQAALNDYTYAIQLEPDLAQSYLSRGIAYSNLIQYSKAIEDFTQAINLKPDLVDAFSQRGAIYLYSGKKWLSLADFAQVIRLQASASAYYNFAIAQYLSEMENEAVLTLNKVLNLDENFVSAYYLRGNLYESLDNQNAAIEDFRQAMELEAKRAGAVDPGDQHGLYARGVARHHMGNQTTAVNDLEQAAQLCQEHQDLIFHEKVISTLVKIQRSSEP
jgi:tetratricopeptide (TPR) repeat protein